VSWFNGLEKVSQVRPSAFNVAGADAAPGEQGDAVGIEAFQAVVGWAWFLPILTGDLGEALADR